MIAAVILALLWTQPEPVRAPEPQAVEVSLVEAPRPADHLAEIDAATASLIARFLTDLSSALSAPA